MDAPRVSQSALRLFAIDMVLPHGLVDAEELMLIDVMDWSCLERDARARLRSRGQISRPREAPALGCASRSSPKVCDSGLFWPGNVWQTCCRCPTS